MEPNTIYELLQTKMVIIHGANKPVPRQVL